MRKTKKSLKQGGPLKRAERVRTAYLDMLIAEATNVLRTLCLNVLFLHYYLPAAFPV